MGGQQLDNYLEVNGERKVTTTKATLGLTDAVVTKTVNDYKSKVLLLKAVKSWIPIGGAILGVVLLAAGALLRRRDGLIPPALTG